MATPLVVATPSTGASADQAWVEDELRRLVARELHDRVAQTLTGMLVEVENFKSQQVEWADVLEQLDKIQGSTRQVLANVRQLLLDLRGEDQLKEGLLDSIRSLATRFEAKSGIAAELHLKPGWPEALSAPAALNVYRIIEEALANVRMHSGARRVRIVLEPALDGQLTLVVTDNGRGVDTDASRPVGLGTVGMRERALLLGGKLRIKSRLGEGTTILVGFPTTLVMSADQPPIPNLITTRGITA